MSGYAGFLYFMNNSGILIICLLSQHADKNNPHIGVIVKMSSNGLKENCSLSVSVMCDPNGVQARLCTH